VKIPDMARASLSPAASESASLQPAFPLLTVDDDGFPHVCLLASEQVAVVGDDLVAVSVAGSTTVRNLHDRGVATIVAVAGQFAHYLTCHVAQMCVIEGRHGFLLAVQAHKADTAGVDLSPIAFRFSPDLAIEERWHRDRAVLAALSGE
jgi:hypothetical protein